MTTNIPDDNSNPKMRLAWQLVNDTGTSLFLTGKAGTGKKVKKPATGKSKSTQKQGKKDPGLSPKENSKIKQGDNAKEKREQPAPKISTSKENKNIYLH